MPLASGLGIRTTRKHGERHARIAGPQGPGLAIGLRTGEGEKFLAAAGNADPRALERQPISADYPFGKIWGMPPPSAGGVGIVVGMNFLEARVKKDKTGWTEHREEWLVAAMDRILAYEPQDAPRPRPAPAAAGVNPAATNNSMPR